MRDFNSVSTVFKAFCEPVRLQIIDLLSCREMCACELLECLSISQSTLSHHMKILLESSLIIKRKDASWSYYSINSDAVKDIHRIIEEITQPKEECSCLSIKKECKK